MLSLATTTGYFAPNARVVREEKEDQTANTLNDSSLPAKQAILGYSIPTHETLGASINALQGLRRLAPNWDSYGGLPPTGMAIHTAQVLLHNVFSIWAQAAGDRIEPELIAPLADGGIQVEWSAHAMSVEVQIGPNGSLGYLRVDRSATPARYDERDDANLDDILTRIASVVAVP